MDFNYYNVYSVVSSSEQQSTSDLEEVLNKIIEMEKITDLESAKLFLKQEFDIDEYTINKSINKNCSLNIIDSEESLIFSFQLPNEDIMYAYEK